jgi:hypothetical protein
MISHPDVIVNGRNLQSANSPMRYPCQPGRFTPDLAENLGKFSLPDSQKETCQIKPALIRADIDFAVAETRIPGQIHGAGHPVADQTGTDERRNEFRRQGMIPLARELRSRPPPEHDASAIHVRLGTGTKQIRTLHVPYAIRKTIRA